MSVKRSSLKLLAVVVFIAGAFWGYMVLRPDTSKWTKLAELNGGSGIRYIVAQQHYDWVEGWGVNFFYVTKDQKLYANSLQIETTPWLNVRLTEEGDSVMVWRGRENVGELSKRTGV